MEELLNALGTVAIILIAVIGLLAGWIAGTIAGRDKGLYMALGVVGAFVTPFLIAALGLGVLAASGIVAILAVALIGAGIVLALGMVLFKR